MVDIDWSKIERVRPSEIRKGDILLVVSEVKIRDGYHKGVWADVKEVQLQPKDSQCTCEKGSIHQFDAYHYACDIYDDKGAHLDSQTFCYPMFFTGHHAKTGEPLPPVMNVWVERSVQG